MSSLKSQQCSWGVYGPMMNTWIEKCAKMNLIQRLWDKDASLWKKDPAEQKEILARLGWLKIAATMKESADDLKSFADEIRKEGFSRVVLLGMGGSSLAPEVFQSTFGKKTGYPELMVLDSTDPDSVRDIESKIDLQKTLFIVSSKSGGTIELVSFFKYFFDKVKEVRKEKASQQFVAITDPGTALVDLAKTHNFRRVFLAPPDVGGRFSALTYFGLVPASLIGVDVAAILDGAEKMMEGSSAAVEYPENEAIQLGVGMAVLAEEGRDKLTIVTSTGLESFGDWAEQLVAESTGKEDLGVVPIVGEPLTGPKVYGEDRFFVGLELESEDNTAFEMRLNALKKAGHPVLTLKMKDASDLGGEFFRWEMATAIACALLKINTFDQPDVQAAKDSTKALLKKIEKGEELAIKASQNSLDSFWGSLSAQDYVGILAFLPKDDKIKKKLQALRLEIRDLTKNAVTLGIGPRYLHSTGQLHKGGPNTGVFFFITAAHAQDLAIPGDKFTFGQLELAQAMGDLEALESKERRVFHVRLEELSENSLDELSEKVTAVLSRSEV